MERIRTFHEDKNVYKYALRCPTCCRYFAADPSEIYWEGGLKFYWVCPNKESHRLLNKTRMNHINYLSLLKARIPCRVGYSFEPVKYTDEEED